MSTTRDRVTIQDAALAEFGGGGLDWADVVERAMDGDSYTAATRPELPYPPAYYAASTRRVRWVGKVRQDPKHPGSVYLDAKHGRHSEYHEQRAFSICPECGRPATFARCEDCHLDICEDCWNGHNELHLPVFVPRPAVVALDLETAQAISEELRRHWHLGCGIEKEAEMAWGRLDLAIAAVEGS